MGRRIEKKVYTGQANPSVPLQDWVLAEHRKFVWDGWLMLLELDGSNMVLRKYTYGLDVSGCSGAPTSGRSALEGAGTIGGVLAMYDTNSTSGTGDDRAFVYLYDGTLDTLLGRQGQAADVGQVVDPLATTAAGSLKAKYDYAPYGARTNTPLGGELNQPFRFSTKYFDAETGFPYFGGRYYQPSLGRWLNRDPIEEAGGPNLHAYAGNDPIDRFDPLGYVCGPNPEDCGGGGGGGDSGPAACPAGGGDSAQTQPTPPVFSPPSAWLTIGWPSNPSVFPIILCRYHYNCTLAASFSRPVLSFPWLGPVTSLVTCVYTCVFTGTITAVPPSAAPRCPGPGLPGCPGLVHTFTSSRLALGTGGCSATATDDVFGIW